MSSKKRLKKAEFISVHCERRDWRKQSFISVHCERLQTIRHQFRESGETLRLENWLSHSVTSQVSHQWLCTCVSIVVMIYISKCLVDTSHIPRWGKKTENANQQVSQLRKSPTYIVRRPVRSNWRHKYNYHGLCIWGADTSNTDN